CQQMGNLVTCPWFNQMYINEGFARYLQFRAANSLFPDWYSLLSSAESLSSIPLREFYQAGGLNNFYSFVYRPARNAAAFGTASALSHEAVADETPFDMTQTIRVSYQIGGSLNRMVNVHLGDEVSHPSLKSGLSMLAQGVLQSSGVFCEQAQVHCSLCL